MIKETVKTIRQSIKDAEPVVKQRLEEAKAAAEEAGKKTGESLGEMIETAKPVINKAITETIDYIKEIADETKPE